MNKNTVEAFKAVNHTELVNQLADEVRIERDGDEVLVEKK